MPRSADTASNEQLAEAQKAVEDIKQKIADAPEGENTEALEMALAHKEAQMRQIKSAGQEQQGNQKKSASQRKDGAKS